ncbi:MAG: hypothetical protein R3E79_02000 [Caldilineaceae bacterium]
MNKNRIQRWAGLGLMLAVGLLVVTAVRVAEARRTPEWQSALATVWSMEQVVEAVRAQRPEAFMLSSDYLIHDSGHFITLPAAPTNVYCAVVRQNTNLQLVFVNYYTDNLWRSGWVVIDDGILPATGEIQKQLDALGCPLPPST